MRETSGPVPGWSRIRARRAETDSSPFRIAMIRAALVIVDETTGAQRILYLDSRVRRQLWNLAGHPAVTATPNPNPKGEA